MPKVPTTFSLAMRPVKAATVARQSPQPSGAKMKQMAEPMAASMDSLSSTISKRQLKLDSSQTSTVDRKITLPAFFTKALLRSHMWMSTPLTRGMW